MVGAGLTYHVGTSWMPLLVDVGTGGIVSPASATLAVTVPATHQVAANGISTGVKTNPDGTLTFSFKGVGDETFSFAAAPFLTGTTSFGAGQTATSYVLASHAAQAAGWRDAIVDIINFHGQRYGAYDLPKLDFAEVSDQAGAAFGPLSTVFIPGSLLGLDSSVWEYRSTLAHELGHQWFGGFIHLGDDNSPWLNEGFATYCEMEYTAALASKANGFDYAPTYRQLSNLRYLYTALGGKDVAPSSAEIYKAKADLYVAVTYDKGGLLVQMLRYLVGETAFLAAMKQYRADHVESEATVASLAASVKAATGKDVTGFLNAWAYAAGYPVCTVDVRRSLVAGQHQTRVSVAADRDPQLPLEVELQTADGQALRKQLLVAGGKSEMTYTTDAEVVQVRFDPDHQLVGRARGALAGDLYLDGEVDGIDLVYAASAQGEAYDPGAQKQTLFPEWADLIFDGKIDQQDLDVVLAAFGKRSGQGG